jgi:hypothetical protein
MKEIVLPSGGNNRVNLNIVHPVVYQQIDKEYTVYTTTIRIKTKKILQHLHLLYCIFIIIRDATCFDPFAGSSSGVQHQS